MSMLDMANKLRIRALDMDIYLMVFWCILLWALREKRAIGDGRRSALVKGIASVIFVALLMTPHR